jgi:hypothetical protein
MIFDAIHMERDNRCQSSVVPRHVPLHQALSPAPSH